MKQANEFGLSRWRVSRMTREGILRRALHEVYVDSALDDTPELRAQAASLVVAPPAIVVDRSAAWLWGVDAMSPVDLDVPPPLELFVPPGKPRVRRVSVRGGERQLLPRDIAQAAGVRLTTPLRTSLDLGCRLRRYEALAAMDAFARVHGIDRPALASELVRFRGRRGVVQLRELVPLVDGRAESPGETFTRLAILAVGLPAPVPQLWVNGDGNERYRLDLAYERLKICVEYDGKEFHSSAEQKARDARRRAWLRANGWVVIVVDKGSFGMESRSVWLAELRAEIEERSQRTQSALRPFAQQR